MTLKNKNSFVDLEMYDLVYQVLRDGRIVEEGKAEMPAIAAGAEASVEIPYTTSVTDDAEYLLKQSGLQVVVSDTGYVPGIKPDCIVEQSPAPGERVKTGHVIYLTVNISHTPTITVPDVIDNCSLREAMAKLSAMGFKLTQPALVDGEKDWVYGLRVKGRHVVAGEKVSVNDYITIEVGSGQRDADMDINYTDAPIEDASEDEFYESGDVDEFHEVP